MHRNLLEPTFPLRRDDVSPEAEACATPDHAFLALAAVVFLLGAISSVVGLGLGKAVF